MNFSFPKLKKVEFVVKLTYSVITLNLRALQSTKKSGKYKKAENGPKYVDRPKEHDEREGWR